MRRLVDCLHPKESEMQRINMTENAVRVCQPVRRQAEGAVIKFAEFYKLNKSYVSLIMPALQLQAQVREFFIGKDFWRSRSKLIGTLAAATPIHVGQLYIDKHEGTSEFPTGPSALDAAGYSFPAGGADESTPATASPWS
mmetsp:Transcript_73384/g.203432  ORF Transcript_73384/g.203432 Transcript_73384/m.203432 type:complete len:140 (+) Transcript_73384:3-422(+)